MPVVAARAPQTTTDWIILGSIVGIVAVFSALQTLQHRRRRNQLAAAARELGLESVDLKAPEAGFAHQPVKGEKSLKLRLCSVGILADRAARLAEYTFQTGSGKHTKTHYNVQLSIECPESWPVLHLCDKPGFMSRPISQLFRPAAPVTEDTAFDKRWQVEGAGAPQTLGSLGPKIRELLLQGDKTELWSIKDGWLTCTWRRGVKGADLPALVARAQQLRTALVGVLGE